MVRINAEPVVSRPSEAAQRSDEEELPETPDTLLAAQSQVTLEEIGETFDLTRERVRQIKEKAIRRLKHTSRSKILKTYLG